MEPIARRLSASSYGSIDVHNAHGSYGPDWPPKRSLAYLLGLNAFVFAYGILIATFGLITLPSEAERMAPQAQAVILAVCVYMYMYMCMCMWEHAFTHVEIS